MNELASILLNESDMGVVVGLFVNCDEFTRSSIDGSDDGAGGPSICKGCGTYDDSGIVVTVSCGDICCSETFCIISVIVSLGKGLK